MRKVALETGKVLERRDLAREYFGEGITIWKSELFELTWQSRVGFVYELAGLRQKRRWSYEGEGWGLTHDATSLIMSDGTNELRVLDPATLGSNGESR